MKTLTYTITINKPVSFVFEKMMSKSDYEGWAKAWGEGMTWDGEWKEGSTVAFFDESGRGTKVMVGEIVPDESIKMEHIAMVEENGKEVMELDETMEKWIGSKEEYYFTAVDENTTDLKIVIVADEAFEPMMQAWDKALVYLKGICEAG